MLCASEVQSQKSYDLVYFLYKVTILEDVFFFRTDLSSDLDPVTRIHILGSSWVYTHTHRERERYTHVYV